MLHLRYRRYAPVICRWTIIFLLSLYSFWSCLFLTAFERLLVIIFSLYITALEIIVLTVFFSLNVNRFISLLIFFLVWCLAYNSVSIISLAIFEWSFLLPCFIESFTSAKVGIMFSRLHVFMKCISASVFIIEF